MRAITIVILLTVLLVPVPGRADLLPKGGGEPGKTMMAFLEAAHKKDFATIRSMYPDGEISKATDRELEENLFMFIQFNPAQLTITGGTAEGDSATLNTLSHGTITMRRINGKWLMEQWRAQAEATIDVSVGAEATFNGRGGEMSERNSSSGESPAAQLSEKLPEPANQPKDVPKTISVALDPQTLQVLPEESGWKVVAVSGTGDDKPLFNMGSNGEAVQAAELLKYYGVAEIVEVSMPGEIEYVLSKSGKVSKGKFKGEQCVAFDPASLTVTEFKGQYRSATGEEVTYTQWSVDSGKRVVMRLNQKPLAEEMVSIVRKYGCRNRCHVGEFWYLTQ